MSSIKVLITNGENLRALMFLRAIANHKDVEIHVAAKRKFSACFFSKYCKHKVIIVDCNENKKLFIKQLAEYIRLNKIDVFIPINSVEVGTVLDNCDSLPKELIIPFVDAKLFHKVNDKWEFAKIMHECKITIPKTIKIDNISHLEKLQIDYPAIIKVRKSAGSKGVVKVSDKEELISKFKETTKNHKLTENELPLVQEYIENGESYGAAAICKDGKVLSVMVYKNLRQYPIQHGTSTSRITVHDEEIEKGVKRILEHIKWHGVVQIDIIKKDDKYYFLEMNPRFYTSLNITVKSGLNYPYYLCMLNDRESDSIPKKYKDRVVCKIFIPDTIVFIKSVFRKNNYPFKEFLNIGFKEVYYDDIDWKDILPFIPLFVKGIRGKLL